MIIHFSVNVNETVWEGDAKLECTFDILQKLLDERGVSAYKMCKEIHIAPSTVTEWKKKRAYPGTSAVVAIAKYFGVTTDFLLGLQA